MKVALIVIICFLFVSNLYGAQNKFNDKITSLLSMKSQAQGAVDTVNQLLHDLLNSNIKEQDDADAARIVWEAEGRQQIAEFTAIRDEMQRVLNNQYEHQNFVQTEFDDTVNHLAWIANRLDEIARKKQELADQRCYQNTMFVKALKEHKDAIEVIGFLRGDLSSCSNQKEEFSFSQLASLKDKLAAYSHLFSKEAMKEFLQLGQEGHVDNARDAIRTAGFESGTEERNLAGSLCDKILAMLDKLEAHFNESLEDLENHEIQAAYDFAEWLRQEEDEVSYLNSETARKEEYKAKLQVDLELAQDAVDKATNDLNEAQMALDEAIAALNRKIAWHENETARRNSENEVLRDVIATFEAQIATMADYLNERVEDWGEGDQAFDKTDLQSRRIDAQIKYDNERLAANVATEAA